MALGPELRKSISEVEKLKKRDIRLVNSEDA
jgi:hypothetical protein